MADLSQNRWYRYSIIGGAFKLQELAYLPQFWVHLWARILSEAVEVLRLFKRLIKKVLKPC